MALAFYVRRIGSRLVPTDDADEETLRRLPELKIVKVSVLQERSARQNAFFHALAKRVADAMQAAGIEYADKDWVTDELKKATGHFDEVMISRSECRRLGVEFGATMRRPRSIDFDAMDHWAFSDWLDRVVRFIVRDLLPHIPTSAFTREVERILDPEERAAWKEHRAMRRAA